MPTQRTRPAAKRNATAPSLTAEELRAVRAYAAAHGQKWKSKLLQGRSSGRLKDDAMWALVNRIGPSGVMRIRLAKANGRPRTIPLSHEEMRALRDYAATYGRTWKAHLLADRMRGEVRDPVLVSLFNRIGPSSIQRLPPLPPLPKRSVRR